MINKKELRIGNKVRAVKDLPDKVILEVESINENSICCLTDSPFHIYCSEQVLKPIPLTPKILEKCGFSKCLSGRGDYSILFDKETPNMSGLFLIIDITDYSVCIGQVDHFSHQFGEFKYLHQLQNLVFSISGKELIYKP